jgi:HEAT repeat protein
MNHSLKSLVGIALQSWSSEPSWNAIAELQMRGSLDTLALTRRLVKSRNARKRALGIYVASQLRQREKSIVFRSTEYALEETQSILLEGLHDACKDVLCAAISGFGHRPHPSALQNLLKFASHTDQEVRFQVAFALGRYSEPDAIDTLLLLARDESDDVRDWATFGIASMHDVDNHEVRELLWINLHDQNKSVQGEALVGLASRKDEAIVPVLLERLTGDCRVFEFEASELIASPLLLDSLNLIKNSIGDESLADTYWYGRLLDAIDACAGKNGTNS